jgi:hypothetical protein
MASWPLGRTEYIVIGYAPVGSYVPISFDMQTFQKFFLISYYAYIQNHVRITCTIDLGTTKKFRRKDFRQNKSEFEFKKQWFKKAFSKKKMVSKTTLKK